MIKIEITRRFKKEVIYKCDADSLKKALIEAVKGGADLRGEEIKEKFGKKCLPLLKKLKKWGFEEYLEKFKEVKDE